MKKNLICAIIVFILFGCTNNEEATIITEITPMPEVTVTPEETVIPEESIKPEETPTPEESTIPESDYEYFDTEIKEITMDSIIVEFEGKDKEIVLDVKDSPHGGYEVGKKIRVYYEGDISRSVLSGYEIKKIEYLD